MGRSVISTSDATAVAYFTFEPDEDFYRETYEDVYGDDENAPDFETVMWKWWEDDAAREFDDRIAWVQDTAKRLWPSFEDANEWHPNRDEQHVILTNAHSEISISEYIGMVALSLSPHYDRGEYWRADDPLGENWRKLIAPKFLATFSEAEKIGTFSNGEAVYRKTGA